MRKGTLNLDEPEILQVHNFNFLPQSSAVAMEFFSRLFDWTRIAKNQKQKIKVVISYDPFTNDVEFSFSKVNDTN